MFSHGITHHHHRIPLVPQRMKLSYIIAIQLVLNLYYRLLNSRNHYHNVLAEQHIPVEKLHLNSSSLNKCKCHPHDGIGGKIAYLITLHNARTLVDTEALFQSIVAPKNIVILHIDKKLSWNSYLLSPLRRLIEQCNCGAKVYIDSVYDCVWGSWNMMDPFQWGTILS